MNSIIDTFIFAGELDTLEIRLKYLSPLVKYFIICESNYTFSGKPKTYYLEENWDRYSPFHHKIKYVQIEQDPSEFQFKDVTYFDESNGPFLMEAQTRNGLMHANSIINDDDLVILSDVDEIWNKNRVLTIAMDARQSASVSLGMNFYGYYLNNRNVYGPDVYWNGSVVSSGRGWLETNPQAIRIKRNLLTSIPDCGWHFSWIGDIKKKIQSFAHVEFNRPEIVSDSAIAKAIETGGDVLQRNGVKYQLVDLSSFPEDLKVILLQYPHLIR